jgi:hypothetical protein
MWFRDLITLIKLGTISGGMAALNQPGPVRVTIALARD